MINASPSQLLHSSWTPHSSDVADPASDITGICGVISEPSAAGARLHEGWCVICRIAALTDRFIDVTRWTPHATQSTHWRPSSFFSHRGAQNVSGHTGPTGMSAREGQELNKGGARFMIRVRFEVFTVVTMKNAVFWDVTPCRSCKNRRFGGT
jgi:hypothetical protein